MLPVDIFSSRTFVAANLVTVAVYGALGGTFFLLSVDLQQVLRGRYLVYYSHASHQPDGRYHAVEIKAEKDGNNLKVIARKGYYASALLDAGIQ